MSLKKLGQESSLKNFIFKPDLLSLQLPASDNAFVSIVKKVELWKRKDVRWSLLTGEVPTNINRFDFLFKGWYFEDGNIYKA